VACRDVPGTLTGKKARGERTAELLCHATSITLREEGRFGKNVSCKRHSDGINLSEKIFAKEREKKCVRSRVHVC